MCQEWIVSDAELEEQKLLVTVNCWIRVQINVTVLCLLRMLQ